MPFMLAIFACGNVNAQDLSRPVEKREITQVNAGPTLVEIKDGNVTVNGEVVSTIADKTECLRLKINTECAKPKMVKKDCDPCARRAVPRCNTGCRTKSRCGSTACQTVRYYDSYSYRPRRVSDSYTSSSSYTGYRSESYSGYSDKKHKSCGCSKSRRDW